MSNFEYIISSLPFLTTDYRDRNPAAIADVRIADGKLVWTASKEPEHCYYRVYKDGKQIASTMATSLDLGLENGQAVRSASRTVDSAVSPAADAKNCIPLAFAVTSVDKWGNEGK